MYVKWQRAGGGGHTLPSSMTRLKKVPAVKSFRAEVAGRWWRRYLGVSSTRGFWKGLFSWRLRAWNICAGVVALTTKMLARRSACRLMCCTITCCHTSCNATALLYSHHCYRFATEAVTNAVIIIIIVTICIQHTFACWEASPDGVIEPGRQANLVKGAVLARWLTKQATLFKFNMGLAHGPCLGLLACMLSVSKDTS